MKCNRWVLVVWYLALGAWNLQMYFTHGRGLSLACAILMAVLVGMTLQGFITDKYRGLVDNLIQKHRDIHECRQTIMDCVARKYGGRG